MRNKIYFLSTPRWFRRLTRRLQIRKRRGKKEPSDAAELNNLPAMQVAHSLLDDESPLAKLIKTLGKPKSLDDALTASLRFLHDLSTY